MQIVGPIVSGFSSEPFKIEGLLYQILYEKSGNDTVIIIFDELNSLDIDSQGILLRLIENREIYTIGKVKITGKLRLLQMRDTGFAAPMQSWS